MVRAGVIKLMCIPQTDRGIRPENVTEKCGNVVDLHVTWSKFSLLIVLVAHVDLFEQSSCPSERNIKWPKTEHEMAKNGWKLSKVAITGSTRSLLAKNGR